MKISETQAKYRLYGQELAEQKKQLMKQRDKAKEQFRITGDDAFSKEAATLQLSIDENNKKYDENMETLDSLTDQYVAVWNAEVAKQQADPECGMGAEISKIMTVARRLSNGDQVPYQDEKKLMEYSSDLYQAAKNAQMMHKLRERKKYESLWEDTEEAAAKYDPEGKAENAEAQGELPEVESLEEADVSTSQE